MPEGMQGRGLRQALDRRGSVISTMPGSIAVALGNSMPLNIARKPSTRAMPGRGRGSDRVARKEPLRE